MDPRNINKDIFESNLYTAGVPDPDLIIRTSGEYRISNFLLWQSAYSEYVFVDCNWTDFNENGIVNIYHQKRKIIDQE